MKVYETFKGQPTDMFNISTDQNAAVKFHKYCTSKLTDKIDFTLNC